MLGLKLLDLGIFTLCFHMQGLNLSLMLLQLLLALLLVTLSLTHILLLLGLLHLQVIVEVLILPFELLFLLSQSHGFLHGAAGPLLNFLGLSPMLFDLMLIFKSLLLL